MDTKNTTDADRSTGWWILGSNLRTCSLSIFMEPIASSLMCANSNLTSWSNEFASGLMAANSNKVNFSPFLSLPPRVPFHPWSITHLQLWRMNWLVATQQNRSQKHLARSWALHDNDVDSLVLCGFWGVQEVPLLATTVCVCRPSLSDHISKLMAWPSLNTCYRVFERRGLEKINKTCKTRWAISISWLV